MRPRLSFIIPALVFLSFAAMENVDVTAVADTVASFRKTHEPPQGHIVPAVYEAPSRNKCPRLEDA